MSLSSGMRLGSYEILTLIGAGGMGEVYRAKDTKLGREVALKILPATFTSDPDRLARFRREAQVLAALNHPHIGAIYGLDEANGTQFLVLELVDGESLDKRIARGKIPVDEALGIAKQIAEALEAAHEKGFIHRDLKPANIAVTTDGNVKVLDFGLAKATEPASGASLDVTNSPTITTPAMMTGVGVILGTAAYMSPEQAKGKPADRRTDVWAFGCVLYEMLTGRRAFDGEDVTETIAAIVRGEPDWSALPANLPPNVRLLLERALVKDRQTRIADIAVARFALDGAFSVAASAPARRSRWERTQVFATAAAAAAALTATALVARTWHTAPPPGLPTRFTLALPDGQQFTNAGRRIVAVSPDGARLAYVANRRIYLRPISSFEATPIVGTDGLATLTIPVFSPDGDSIAFVTDASHTVKRIATAGGVAVTLWRSDDVVASMTWDASGIVCVTSAGVVRLAPGGGKPESLIPLRRGELIRTAQLLPGGRTALVTLNDSAVAVGARDVSKVVVHNLDTGERTVLVEGANDAQFVQTGQVVYLVGGTIFAIPFDATRLTSPHAASPIVEGIWRSGTNGIGQYAFSQSGTLAYVPGPGGLTTDAKEIAIIDRSGRIERKLGIPPGPFEMARSSPDGRRIALQSDDGRDAAIWLYDLAGDKQAQRLTFDGKNRFPVWTPDGQRLAFQSDRGGTSTVFWQRIDRTGQAERLMPPEEGVGHLPASFSPSGDVLLFSKTTRDSTTLWTYSLRDRKASLVEDRDSVAAPASVFSPNGKWIVHGVDRDGTVDGLYVQPFPTTGNKYQITRNRGRFPVWSRDGNSLFYLVGPNQMETVNVTTTPDFAVSNATLLTTAASMFTTGVASKRQFDILPDGRFVSIIAAGQIDSADATPQIRVVVNWTEELKQRVPTK